MIPTAYSNKNKQDETDDGKNKVIALDNSDDEENTLTNEEITTKGEQSLMQMKQLIKEAKLSKVSKAIIKQCLQHINSYVNKLKQSDSATIPV